MTSSYALSIRRVDILDDRQDPSYMEYETPMNCKACSFKCLCSAFSSICSSLKLKTRAIKCNFVACISDPSSIFKTTTNTNDPDNSKIKTFKFFGPRIMRHSQIPAKEGIIRSLDSAYKLIYE
ncbi:hypothetical protein PIROE2DRAFT_19104 [Piromyces sp. E2]|nr:hypothetical protein PIROE2DRAFT_19104 [Piromyces sp. E2]|eukprot:OUM56332.1 hypothetical protein PIROE2DRAFT_19104 [Piromyces sp. E2]